MNKNQIIYKIDTLLSNSPSIMRIGVTVWPLRIISFILFPIFLIGGTISILASMAFVNLIERLEKNINQMDLIKYMTENYIKELKSYVVIMVIGGITMLIGGILFLIIAWLCRLVRTRNMFISETKDTLNQIKVEINTP